MEIAKHLNSDDEIKLLIIEWQRRRYAIEDCTFRILGDRRLTHCARGLHPTCPKTEQVGPPDILSGAASNIQDARAGGELFETRVQEMIDLRPTIREGVRKLTPLHVMVPPLKSRRLDMVMLNSNRTDTFRCL
jgi:hypothetical protein